VFTFTRGTYLASAQGRDAEVARLSLRVADIEICIRYVIYIYIYIIRVAVFTFTPGMSSSAQGRDAEVARLSLRVASRLLVSPGLSCVYV